MIMSDTLFAPYVVSTMICVGVCQVEKTVSYSAGLCAMLDGLQPCLANLLPVCLAQFLKRIERRWCLELETNSSGRLVSSTMQ
jgi:hypothetical protein